MNVKIIMGETYIPVGATIPTVKVSLWDSEKDRIISAGYLTPFRRYCFQVSLNEKGDCDMGASPVIEDMRPLMRGLSEETGKSFLTGQAAMAVQAFIPSEYRGNPVFVERFSYKYYSKDFLGLTQDENIKNWSKFIDMCYDWIKG